jgi:hypothetical protein
MLQDEAKAQPMKALFEFFGLTLLTLMGVISLQQLLFGRPHRLLASTRLSFCKSVFFRYAGKYPEGYWPCWDHGRRTGVRQFKLSSLKLVVFLKDDGTELLASISHLKELRRVLENSGVLSGIQSGDLELGLLFDQNSDAADRLPTLRIVQLPDEWVQGLKGTQLVISALYYIFEPYRDPTMTPHQVVEFLARGRQIAQDWRCYVELYPKLKLRSLRSGVDRKGNFWSGPCYNGVEALVATGICYVLAYKKHYMHLGAEGFYLRSLCTHQTEKIAMDLSGKCNFFFKTLAYGLAKD